MSNQVEAKSPGAAKGRMVKIIVFLALLLVIFWKISIISVGYGSSGHIGIVWKEERLSDLRILDSDRAACVRQGATSFVIGFCSGHLATILQHNRIFTLPYMGWFASLTGGR